MFRRSAQTAADKSPSIDAVKEFATHHPGMIIVLYPMFATHHLGMIIVLYPMFGMLIVLLLLMVI